MHRLLLSVPGPFVLVAPADRNLSVEVRELLQRRGVEFLSLEEQVLMEECGRLVAASTAQAADAIEATPVEDRRRTVKEFMARNNCKVRDIQEAAGVDKAAKRYRDRQYDSRYDSLASPVGPSTELNNHRLKAVGLLGD